MTAYLHGTVLNTDEHTLDEVSDYNVTSTSFTDVDGTHLALNITVDNRANTGQALVGWHGNVAVSSGQTGYFNLLVNGTLHAGNDGILFAPAGTLPVSFTRLVTGLTVGTLNTCTLQAKVTGGTMTVFSGAGTSAVDTHGQFWQVTL
jgi:hypothetical protein